MLLPGAPLNLLLLLRVLRLLPGSSVLLVMLGLLLIMLRLLLFLLGLLLIMLGLLLFLLGLLLIMLRLLLLFLLGLLLVMLVPLLVSMLFLLLLLRFLSMLRARFALLVTALLLSMVLLFALLFVLSVGRSGDSEKQGQNGGAGDSYNFHMCYLRCCWIALALLQASGLRVDRAADGFAGDEKLDSPVPLPSRGVVVCGYGKAVAKAPGCDRIARDSLLHQVVTH